MCRIGESQKFGADHHVNGAVSVAPGLVEGREFVSGVPSRGGLARFEIIPAVSVANSAETGYSSFLFCNTDASVSRSYGRRQGKSQSSWIGNLVREGSCQAEHRTSNRQQPSGGTKANRAGQGASCRLDRGISEEAYEYLRAQGHRRRINLVAVAEEVLKERATQEAPRFPAA